jgi:multisubunit Na+/H+ antiporter MnhE subunit
VYLVVIAWMYVVLMMSVAEATNTTGTVLGAIVTFVLYGLLPMGLVVYIMSTPARKRKIKAREAAELAAANAARAASSLDPDTSGHAAGAAEPASIAPVGKES